MHRIYFCFIALFFLGTISLNAQLKVDFAGGTASSGSTIDVDVVVSDFDQLISIQYSINWDPSAFTFNSILNATDALPGFSISSVGTPAGEGVVEGQLTVSWSDNSTNPFSLPDNTRLFTIRLNASGAPCAGTTLEVTSTPRFIEIVDGDINVEDFVIASGGDIMVEGTDCNGGGGGGDCTDTCAGSSEVSLIASCEEGESDDNICVTVTGRNISNLASIQTGVSWDPSVLSYSGTTSKDLAVALNENETNNGILRVLWSFTEGPLTLSDNSELFDICFDVVGSRGQSSNIEFVDLPNSAPPLFREILDFDNNDLGGCFSSGIIEVTDGDGGGGGPTGCSDVCEDSNNFSLIASCETGKAGETTCVTVTARNFTDLSAISTGIAWNSSVLRYSSFVEKDLTGIAINDADASTGSLRVLWSASLAQVMLSLPDDSELFDICFDAIGSQGQGSDIEFVDLPDNNLFIEVVDGNINSIPFCLSKGEIEIEREQQATPLSLTAGDISGERGEEVCMNIVVEGFEDIQSAQFTIQWDADVLTYTQLMNINLPEFGNSNANFVSPDKLTISWNPLSTASLSDGTSLFQVCFDVIGNNGANSDIEFIDDRVDIEFSNGNDEVLDPIINNGSITVGSGGGGTDGLELTAGNITGDMGEESCLSIRVVDFEDITSAQFTIEWDDDVLDYTQVASVRFPGFDDADAQFLAPDRLRVSWSSATPFSLSNNSILMQACFNVIGECDSNISSNIRFLDGGLTFGNSSGQTITPTVNAGSIRVGQCAEICNISVSSQVNDNTCDQRGRIDLTVSGENGRLDYDWDNNLSNSGLQTGLRGGTYCVTITDDADCEFTRCYTVRELFFDVSAFVDDATCDRGGTITLETELIDEDLRLDYNWEAPLRDNETVQTNLDAGQYCVTVSERVSNCVQQFCYTVGKENDLDITETITPVTNLDANNGAIALEVVSTDDLSYVWSNEATSKDITGLAPGNYSVTITGGGDCEVIQSYNVDWNAIFADNINAEQSGNVSCMGELDGIISGEITGGCGGNRVYLDGDVVELPITGLAPGSYVISVDDSCGNAAEKTIVISDPTMIEASASAIECSDAGGSTGKITLDISGGTGPYELDPSSGTASGNMVTDLGVGTVMIVIADSNGCEILQEYTIEECTATLGCDRARNVISPDGDGVNDQFIIGCLMGGSTVNQPNELGIYDRWGREVFGATNYDNTWEGTDESGAKLPEGGYMWVLTVDAAGQPRQVYRGTVTLLRDDF